MVWHYFVTGLTCLDVLLSSQSWKYGKTRRFWSLSNFNGKLSFPPPPSGRPRTRRDRESPLTEGSLLLVVNVGDGLESVEHHGEGREEALQPLEPPPGGGESLLLSSGHFILPSCWFSLLWNAENSLELQEALIDIQMQGKCRFWVVLPPSSIAFQISW